MRNLIFLIRQYYTFFIFLVLEIICFGIIFRNNNYQQTSYINSSKTISGSLYAKRESMFGFLHYKEVNDSLLKENARLKQELGITVKANPLKDTEYTNIKTIDSVTQTTHYRYIPCKVLNNSIDQKVNYITLNAGSNQGVKKNYAVIGDNGIVGKISHVSPNYSVAVSILSEKFNVSAMVPDGSIGTVYWDGINPNLVTLKGIPQSVKIKPLDSVYTSGYSIFPEKILIGRAAKSLHGTSYQLWLTTNFQKLHYVYIVEDITNIERLNLEDTSRVE